MPDAESVAKLFHDAYERLAPAFGYETRKETRVPWEQVPEDNKHLMIAATAEVLAMLFPPQEAAPAAPADQALAASLADMTPDH